MFSNNNLFNRSTKLKRLGLNVYENYIQKERRKKTHLFCHFFLSVDFDFPTKKLSFLKKKRKKTGRERLIIKGAKIVAAKNIFFSIPF